jgi:hypothetical protein
MAKHEPSLLSSKARLWQYLPMLIILELAVYLLVPKPPVLATLAHQI